MAPAAKNKSRNRANSTPPLQQNARQVKSSQEEMERVPMLLDDQSMGF